MVLQGLNYVTKNANPFNHSLIKENEINPPTNWSESDNDDLSNDSVGSI